MPWSHRNAPAMSRGHFELIAQVLKETNASEHQVRAFADALQSSNRNFNYNRFVSAAGKPMKAGA